MRVHVSRRPTVGWTWKPRGISVKFILLREDAKDPVGARICGAEGKSFQMDVLEPN
jgi:hypothetical protein